MRTSHSGARYPVAILVLAFVWCSVDVQAGTYYVRKSGNDGNSGTTPAQAFLTIKKAATVASAGDTVYVGAGTYTDKAEVSNDGTSTDPIRFVADSAGTYTFDAGDVIVNVITVRMRLKSGFLASIQPVSSHASNVSARPAFSIAFRNS